MASKTKTYPILSPIRHEGEIKKTGHIELGADEAARLRRRGAVGDPATLPDDYPGREALLAAGLATEGQVLDAGREQIGAIDGIGEKTLKAIFKGSDKSGSQKEAS